MPRPVAPATDPAPPAPAAIVPAASAVPSAAPARASSCVHCGAPLHTAFCARCGERRAADRDFSMRAFIGELVVTITGADGTLHRTVRTLFRRPGELTAAFMRGEWIRYTRPLQLFLLANVFYFLLASSSGSRVFDTPLSVHLGNTFHRGVAGRMVEARLAERGLPLETYARTFDRVATLQAKTLIIAMVPLWAVGLALVQARKRRFALEHLVFALHYFSALLVLMVATHLLVGKPLIALVRRPDGTVDWRAWDDWVTLVNVAVQVTYLTLAQRRAYGDGVPVAVVKAVALVAVFMITLFAYRALLFFTVYWST